MNRRRMYPIVLSLLCCTLLAAGIGCPPADSVNPNKNDTVMFGGPATITVSEETDFLVNISSTVADFNGDGWPDLAICRAGESAASVNRVSVALGNGDGTFADGIESEFAGEGLVQAFGDFDGDGRMDILRASDLNAHRWEVLLSNGDGTFTAADLPVDANLPTVNHHTFPVADYDQDGTHDVLIQTDDIIEDCSAASPAVPEVTNKLLLLRGDGIGGFAAPQVVDTGLPADCRGGRDSSGDVNGDGIVDRISPVGERIVAQLGTGVNGAVGNEIATEFALDARLRSSIAIGDIDGDGHGDLANFTRSEPDLEMIAIYSGRGDGTFEFKRNLFTMNHRGSEADGIKLVQILDMNGDGHNDIVAIVGGQDSPLADPPNVGIDVFFGDGAGAFENERTFITDRGDYLVLGILDLNGDGKLDLLLGVQEGNTVDVLLQE